MTFFATLFLFAAFLLPHQAAEIGDKVWQNECGHTIEGLTAWNDGEEFASLGIGHFIWYPEHARGPFVETFPELIRFFKLSGVEIPAWLDCAHGCPWKTQSEFRRAIQNNNQHIADLRQLLQKNIPLQAQFLQKRFEDTLPILLAQAKKEKNAAIEELYHRLIACPNGRFVILDYVNFKGYGTTVGERYDGCGWGLYQVLENMPHHPEKDPITQFIASAKAVLERRVQRSDPKRNEQRFLKGWFKRLENYQK